MSNKKSGEMKKKKKKKGTKKNTESEHTIGKLVARSTAALLPGLRPTDSNLAYSVAV